MSFFPTVTQRFVAYNQKVENNLLIIEGDIVKINTILFEKWFFNAANVANYRQKNKLSWLKVK